MEIELGGKNKNKAIISIIDYNKVTKYKWHLSNKGYVEGLVDNKLVKLHRFIMNAKEDDIIDHVNSNPLDNQRENLRESNDIKNAQNRKIHKNKTSSKYKGVFFRKDMEMYFVDITLNGKREFIGYFDNEIMAAEAYDTFMLKNNVTHAPLNFPEKSDVLSVKTYIPTKERLKRNITSTEYYGVKTYKNGYRSTISINGKSVHIKKSQDPIECAKAYDEYVCKNNIYEKKLNFPEIHPEYSSKKIIRTFCQECEDTEVVRLVMFNKDINVLIDKKDYELVKFYKCSYDGVRVTIKTDKLEYIHRWLLNVTDKNIIVDHINGDVCDNRRKNLRLSDSKLNAQNKSKQSGSTSSKYIGVSYSLSKKRWRASMRKDGKILFEKCFLTEEEACRYRDLYIILKLPQSHYKKNLDWTDDQILEWKNKVNIE